MSGEEVEVEKAPLRITGLASDGRGLGRLEDGRVVFVEGGVPGDLVELEGLRLEKRMASARVGRIVEPSADRVEPRCAHFGRCGGCAWQHIEYSAQLEAKRRIVRDALERIGGLLVEGELEIVGSPDAYGYRARARLVECAEGFGYRKRGSREIEVVSECPILVPEARGKLRSVVEQRRLQDSDYGTARSGSLLGADAARTSRSAIEWEMRVGSSGDVEFHRMDSRNEFGSHQAIGIDVLDERLQASMGSFVQGNALLWEALAAEVRSQCLVEKPGPDSTIGSRRQFVELYAGIGFFTLALARAGFHGTVFESSRTALSDLAANLDRAGLANQIQVVAGRVERRDDWAARFVDADLLLLDPPRVGLEASLREVVAKSGPQRVVYVSCDPATLSRDLRAMRAGGYRVAKLRAFDLFPQTAHVEVVVRLERESVSNVDGIRA